MQDVWFFAYGSLLWRPSFDHVERRPARLDGFARRFWQGSTDHRGVPGAPGRVVTLVEAPGTSCSGAAYRVAAAHVERTVAMLDHREKGGYVRRVVDLALASPEATVRGVVYVADQGNPDFLGPASIERIAEQVRHASGPSGRNAEYVLRLAEALRAMGIDDPHVSELERALLNTT